MGSRLTLTALDEVPEIRAGDNLAALIGRLTAQQLVLTPDPVLVLAQKIVSKAEGRFVALSDVVPGDAAKTLADEVDKDPRLVELILSESRSILRKRPGVLIVEHRCGHVLANAGIDTSNIQQREEEPSVLLWPRDPDASARQLSAALRGSLGFAPVVIINDSIGRAWRNGTVGHAIGCSGLKPLWNQKGARDRHGNELRVTEPATADGLAAAAALLQGEAAEGLPVVWIEGSNFRRCEQSNARALLRDKSMDLFR